MPNRTPGNAQVTARVRISAVTPQVECGRYSVKRVVGERVDVRATVVADGHAQVRAELRYRKVGTRRWARVPMTEAHDEPDRFEGAFCVDTTGRWEYAIDAWVDLAATWHDELRRKVEAGETELGAEIAEGEVLLGVPLADVAAALDAGGEVRMATTSLGAPLSVIAEPALAAFGAWYELFPRSFGGFDGVRAALPDVADLGFDIVYLPPLHPIGTTNRKGRNNALAASDHDPGSPWAIGGPAGGHTAVHPDLGTLADFDRLVERAHELGLEIALDFAVQCSPDHPWLAEHPEWFAWRPDGSVKYAENPPKRYQDIVNFDFDSPNAAELWRALLGVVEHWIGHGVRVFRVDNPHTKPFAFWEWLITSVRDDFPDVVFLAEAFTRPAVMSTLAKIGFSQSYTYFTWRNTRVELESYVRELAGQTDWFRPNFFVNTPDIFHEYLQLGGGPAFAARIVLAATLSPSWGMYSGFERAAGVALRPGSEEYRDSEKYQCSTGTVGGELGPLVRRCNEIRRASDVFRRVDNVTFVDTAHDQLIGYVKGRGSDAVTVCVNLDPHADCEGLVTLPDSLGLPEQFAVVDLLSGGAHDWRVGDNYVRLPPGGAHVLVQR